MPTRSYDEKPVQYSFLDRLINDEQEEYRSKGNRKKFDAGPAESIRNFKDLVRRDLEWLLNTRVPPQPTPGKETERSLYTYGLPEIGSLSLLGEQDQRVLTRAMQAAIVKFEPRIANPRVSLVAAPDPTSRSLRFVIQGTLRIEPNPEPIELYPVLDLSSGQYKVPGDASA